MLRKWQVVVGEPLEEEGGYAPLGIAIPIQVEAANVAEAQARALTRAPHGSTVLRCEEVSP